MLLVYITTKNKAQAAEIGKKLVQERIVACVNIVDGMQSIYWWEGKICEDNEAILIAKTSDSLFNNLLARVKELHSYTVPCIVAIPIKKGNPDYINWLQNEIQS